MPLPPSALSERHSRLAEVEEEERGWLRLGDAPERPHSRPATPPPAKEVPLPPGLSETAWHETRDPMRSLMHALSRIPVRHGCLVLGQLAERVWPEWDRRLPDDWRPGFCLVALRAWCFGEASLSDLDAARGRLHKTVLSTRRNARTERPAYAMAAVVEAHRSATLFAGFEAAGEISLEPALDVLDALSIVGRAGDPQVAAARHAAEWAGRSDSALTRVWAGVAQRALKRAEDEARQRLFAELADCIRAWIPYPARRSREWKRRGNVVCAGDAVLVLDGWRIVDAQTVNWRPRYPRYGWV